MPKKKTPSPRRSAAGRGVAGPAISREALLTKIAEAMCPAEWGEFHRRKGIVENCVGWELKKSLQLSTNVLKYLIDNDLLDRSKVI